MKNIFQWIHDNPKAFNAFLAVVISWIGKVIFAFTGKLVDLGPWGAVIDEGTYILVGGITAYGLFVGANHASRGPALTDVDQAATIVAAIKGPPISESITEVKTVAAEVKTVAEGVIAISPTIPVVEPMDSHIHKF